MQPSFPETAVIRNYLDACLELPWNNKTDDNINIKKAQKILDAGHYGLTDVKKRIIELLAVRKLNPDCGFVLLDKLEQMDLSTLRAFGAWLEQEGLQAIATRVSTGGECQIIIEDGRVAEPAEPAEPAPAAQPAAPGYSFQGGLF